MSGLQPGHCSCCCCRKLPCWQRSGIPMWWPSWASACTPPPSSQVGMYKQFAVVFVVLLAAPFLWHSLAHCQPTHSLATPRSQSTAPGVPAQRAATWQPGRQCSGSTHLELPPAHGARHRQQHSQLLCPPKRAPRLQRLAVCRLTAQHINSAECALCLPRCRRWAPPGACCTCTPANLPSCTGTSRAQTCWWTITGMSRCVSVWAGARAGGRAGGRAGRQAAQSGTVTLLSCPTVRLQVTDFDQSGIASRVVSNDAALETVVNSHSLIDCTLYSNPRWMVSNQHEGHTGGTVLTVRPTHGGMCFAPVVSAALTSVPGCCTGVLILPTAPPCAGARGDQQVEGHGSAAGHPRSW
jgi:hypothetical protein